ncbi:hypothetical protein [Mycobacterium sp. RTGN5]|nr:hypothetical protein [Mycobacterium sp. RTGN5]
MTVAVIFDVTVVLNVIVRDLRRQVPDLAVNATLVQSDPHRAAAKNVANQ